MTNNSDIVVSLILATTMLSMVLLTDAVVLRTVVALPLLFFLSGHLALRAIGTTLPPIEYALAAVGMSFVVCIFGCFVLYGLSALTPLGWAWWIVFVVGALSAWIICRHSPGGLVICWPVMRRWHVATIGIAALITVGAYFLAISDEADTREFAYTEFWLVAITPGKLTLGIRNQEIEPKTYDISVRAQTEPIAELHSIKLVPGETWTRVVDSKSTKTEATLYLNKGDHERIVYRHVSALPYRGRGVK
jgi:hypothetical protein